MATFFAVKDFDRFQHYKDRAPPWIKLYNSTLEDYEFGRLPDASKAHLIAIWLLASRSSNRIPYDAQWVGGKISATSPVDLDILLSAGFIVMVEREKPQKTAAHQMPDGDASKPLAECKQSACLEREREGEQRESREERVVAQSAPAKPDPRGSRLSLESLPPDWREWCRTNTPNLEPDRQWADFHDYWTAKGGKDARKVDWLAAWRVWCRKSADYQTGPPADRPKPLDRDAIVRAAEAMGTR